MLKSKTIDRIGCLAAVAMLVITAVVWAGKASAGKQSILTVGYEGLFDQSYVHTIDIVMEDVDSFIANATQEQYVECTVTIDGEKVSNAGIRAKGNTSLSSVSTLGSRKYSFKIEFNQYAKGKTFHGLDKLSLNNLIYDATMMKDYLAYTLMGRMGVPSSLCSFAQVTINGEAWGLYLAVEGVEDGFLQRNNMTTGEVYKPDSLSFGGGRGNGRDFDFEQFRVEEDGATKGTENQQSDAGEPGQTPGSEASSGQPAQNEASSGQPAQNEASSGQPAQNEASSGQPDSSQVQPNPAPGQDTQPTTPSNSFTLPEGMQVPEGFSPPEGMQVPEGFTAPQGMDGDGFNPGFFQMGGGMFNFGTGSSDVKLQYIDDDPESYSNILENAKTEVSDSDKARLIETLKVLNSENARDAVNTDEVIRYLAVHDFLQNGDSYTGMMIHNYYLYEEDGVLQVIPWDYNLAFGGMNGSDGTSTINSPIDTPVSNSTGSDRPLISWIFQDEESLARYHEIYSQFVADTIESGWLASEIKRVSALIRPYVESDPNSFFTVDEYDTAIENLQNYCALRGQSIRGQLDGTIPSTSSGQNADRSALIDGSSVSISDMGSMNAGGGEGGSAMPGGFPGQGTFPSPGSSATPSEGGNTAQASGTEETVTPGEGFNPGGSFTPPEGFNPGGSFTSPEGFNPGGSFTPPEGFNPGSEASSAQGKTGWILYGASILLLLAGCLVISRLKGHNE